MHFSVLYGARHGSQPQTKLRHFINQAVRSLEWLLGGIYRMFFTVRPCTGVMKPQEIITHSARTYLQTPYSWLNTPIAQWKSPHFEPHLPNGSSRYVGAIFSVSVSFCMFPLLVRFWPIFNFKLKWKRSQADMKILPLELWLRLITTRYYLNGLTRNMKSDALCTPHADILCMSY